MTLEKLGRDWLVEVSADAHPTAQAAGLSVGNNRRQRDEAGDRTPAAGDDDFLPFCRAIYKLGEAGLGLVDVDMLSHWSGLVNQKGCRRIPLLFHLSPGGN